MRTSSNKLLLLPDIINLTTENTESRALPNVKYFVITRPIKIDADEIVFGVHKTGITVLVFNMSIFCFYRNYRYHKKMMVYKMFVITYGKIICFFFYRLTGSFFYHNVSEISKLVIYLSSFQCESCRLICFRTRVGS